MKTLSPVARARERLAQLRLLFRPEQQLTKKISNLIAKQGETLANHYKANQSINVAVLDEHKNEFHNILRPAYVRVINLFAAHVRKSVKSGLFMQLVMQWIAQRALETISDVDDTTVSVAKIVISDGMASGLGTEAIARNISASCVPNINLPRARVIARTECHAAAMFGSKTAAKDTGLNGLVKTWCAANDARTRPDHAAADGQTVPIDQPFIVGGESIDRPGEGSASESINCRCVMTYSVQKTTDS